MSMRSPALRFAYPLVLVLLALLVNGFAGTCLLKRVGPIAALRGLIEQPSLTLDFLAMGLGSYLLFLLVVAVVAVIIWVARRKRPSILAVLGWSTCAHLAVLGLAAAASSPQRTSATPPSVFIVDPVAYIEKHGLDSRTKGDSAHSYLNTKQIVRSEDVVIKHHDAIAALPKNEETFRLCDFLRGGVKATLVEERGLPIDVVLMNHGVEGPVLACSLRMVLGSEAGSIVVFFRAIGNEMYSLYVREAHIH